MALINDDLIAAVFEKRCLWEQKHKLYHNRQIVEQNWTEIAKALNQDTICVKKKWKQLRDTFRTELRKKKAEYSGDPGPDGVYEIHSQWAHFKSLMFLKDQMKWRKSSSNLKSVKEIHSNDEEDDNSSSIDVEVPKMPQKQGNNETYCSESNRSTFEEETPITTSKNARVNLKRRHDDMKAEIINIERKKLELMRQKSKNQNQSDDEDMAFFVSLLPYVKKMDPETKLLCRMEIQRSVYNHAYKNKSSRIQNLQHGSSYVCAQSPMELETVSMQLSDTVSSPQHQIEYIVKEEEDITPTILNTNKIHNF